MGIRATGIRVTGIKARAEVPTSLHPNHGSHHLPGFRASASACHHHLPRDNSIRRKATDIINMQHHRRSRRLAWIRDSSTTVDLPVRMDTTSAHMAVIEEEGIKAPETTDRGYCIKGTVLPCRDSASCEHKSAYRGKAVSGLNSRRRSYYRLCQGDVARSLLFAFVDCRAALRIESSVLLCVVLVNA